MIRWHQKKSDAFFTERNEKVKYIICGIIISIVLTVFGFGYYLEKEFSEMD